jgi:RNA exonuclease 1
LNDIHSLLRTFIDSNTIVVGHSLDSDLKALQLVHERVIDTAMIYPHNSGLPYKISLKQLAKVYLSQSIQDFEGLYIIFVICDVICVIDMLSSDELNPTGHDSVQDAVVSLELVFLMV